MDMRVTSSPIGKNVIELMVMRMKINTLETKQEVFNERNWSVANDGRYSPDAVFLELFQKRKQDTVLVFGTRQVGDTGAFAARRGFRI
jgi:hypothetical protein